MHHETPKTGSFLHRIRAVGDYDSVDVFFCKQFVDPVSEFEPDCIGHVLATDARDLFAGDAGDVFKSRDDAPSINDPQRQGD